MRKTNARFRLIYEVWFAAFMFPENDLVRADAKKAGNNRPSGGSTGFGTSRKGEKGKKTGVHRRERVLQLTKSAKKATFISIIVFENLLL